MIPMIFLTAHSGCDTENILGEGQGLEKGDQSGAGEAIHVRGLASRTGWRLGSWDPPQGGRKLVESCKN